MTITKNPDGSYYVVCTPLQAVLLRLWVLECKVSSIKLESLEQELTQFQESLEALK